MSDRQLLYFIGEPGVGKSTLANYLTRDLHAHQIGGPPAQVGEEGWHPVPHILYFDQDVSGPARVGQLGCMHESGFHGTDRLRRDIMPFFLRWVCNSFPDVPDDVVRSIFSPDTFRNPGYPDLEPSFHLSQPAPRLILAEGDRLATEAFFDWCGRVGYTLHLVLLYGDTVAAERRAQRGTTQNENWIKGRRSLAQRLALAYGARRLPAHQPLDVQAAALVDNPVVRALADARGGL